MRIKSAYSFLIHNVLAFSYTSYLHSWIDLQNHTEAKLEISNLARNPRQPVLHIKVSRAVFFHLEIREASANSYRYSRSVNGPHCQRAGCRTADQVPATRTCIFSYLF